jgi:hypothetical protein
MARYMRAVWQHVVLRFWIDIAGAALVFLTVCALAMLIYIFGHSVWGMQFRLVKQSLTALAAIYLVVILMGAIRRHWALWRATTSPEREAVPTSRAAAAGTDAGPDSSVSRS